MAVTPRIYFYDKPSELVQEEHVFLNNFFVAPMHVDTKLYITVEHYYQCQKFDPASERARAIRAARNPGEAKKLAQSDYDVAEWARKKDAVMMRGLRAKFTQHPLLAKQLVQTGDAILVEASDKDSYWGGLLPDSSNRLGAMLMELRDEFREKSVAEQHRAGASVLVPSPQSAKDAHHSAEHASDIHVHGVDASKAESLADRRYSEAVSRALIQSMAAKFAFGRHTTAASGVRVDSDPAERLKVIVDASPLSFLPRAALDVLAATSVMRVYAPSDVIIAPGFAGDAGEAFIVVTGEAYTTDNAGTTFLEELIPSTFFGYQMSFFGKRYVHAIASTRCVVVAIPSASLLQVTEPMSLFALALARNLTTKHDIFGALSAFRTHVLDGVRSGHIDILEMVRRFRLIDSALHVHCNNRDYIDFAAWSYAIERLPQCVLNTYVFLCSSALPDLYAHPELSVPITSALRARAVFKLNEGKALVVMRELETDLLDFAACLSIHIVESEKLRKRIGSPQIMSELMVALREGENDESHERLLAFLFLSDDERAGLRKLFPRTRWLASILDVVLHHGNYQMLIDRPRKFNAADPAERWTHSLAAHVRTLLGLEPSVALSGSDVPNLVCDVFQGSTRTAMACLSPWLHQNRAKIAEWGAANNIKLVTKVFPSEADRIYALSFYYLRAHPAEAEAKRIMEEEAGIVRITETELTGVQIILFDVNRLNPELCDPAFRIRPASECHLLVCIGYTFGSQSADIMRCLVMCFGSHLRSMNIYGKAGGLCGARGDIMVATKILRDSDNSVVNNHAEDIRAETLRELSGRAVHVGPMLTVAGVILQNEQLLLFHRKLFGCVGLEMEGVFFAQEIQRSKELGFLPPAVRSRFVYYSSDLPLDPTSNLAHEGDAVSWDEGVTVLTAIFRHLAQLVFEQA